jgi:hypothetical protein
MELQMADCRWEMEQGGKGEYDDTVYGGSYGYNRVAYLSLLTLLCVELLYCTCSFVA